jgi:hypothetical protein
MVSIEVTDDYVTILPGLTPTLNLKPNQSFRYMNDQRFAVINVVPQSPLQQALSQQANQSLQQALSGQVFARHPILPMQAESYEMGEVYDADLEGLETATEKLLNKKASGKGRPRKKPPHLRVPRPVTIHKADLIDPYCLENENPADILEGVLHSAWLKFMSNKGEVVPMIDRDFAGAAVWFNANVLGYMLMAFVFGRADLGWESPADFLGSANWIIWGIMLSLNGLIASVMAVRK